MSHGGGQWCPAARPPSTETSRCLQSPCGWAKCEEKSANSAENPVEENVLLQIVLLTNFPCFAHFNIFIFFFLSGLIKITSCDALFIQQILYLARCLKPLQIKTLSVVSTVKLVHCWTFFILEGSANTWLGMLSHIAGFSELCVSTHTW